MFSSVAATRDHMEFLRTRTIAHNYLIRDLNIRPAQIDGGFEFNAWHFYDYNYQKTKDKNWWWVQDDEYVVTWGKIKNYELIKEFDFKRWNPPGQKQKVFVYKRIEK